MTYLPPAISAAPPLALPPVPSIAARILAVAAALQPDLAQGFQIDALRLQLEMERAFGGSDAAGAFGLEATMKPARFAVVLFLRKFEVMRSLARAGSPTALAPILAKLSSLVPTHTPAFGRDGTLQQLVFALAHGAGGLGCAADHTQ